MRSINFTLSISEFSNLFYNFTDEVKCGRYDKLDYFIWKDIQNNIIKYNVEKNEICKVEITFNFEDNYLMTISGEVIPESIQLSFLDKVWTFYDTDASFGEYLNYNYKDKISEEAISSLQMKITETNMTIKAYCDTAYGTHDNLLNDYCSSNALSTKADVADYDIVSPLENLKVNLSAETTKAIQELADKLQETRYELNLDKEENKDMMKGFNFEFGPLNNHLAKMSIYGLAVKNKSGVYVSYDKDRAELIDVDVFQFDGSKFLYRMPVAIKDIAVGDVVIHQNIPTFVVEIPTHGKTLIVVDPCNGERKEIMLTRSPFGFNFATKIVNFLDGMMHGVAPSADNPFGNMWMLALMDGDNKDMSKMLPFMFMNQNGMNMDPMMMMLMMGDNKDMGDMLPLMMMMNMNKSAVAHECKCGGHCSDHSHANEKINRNIVTEC